MTKTKPQTHTHTPGPWHVVGESRSVASEFGVIVSLAHGPSGEWQEVKDEHNANARLIAAAPDLLVAAKALLDADTYAQIDAVSDTISRPAVIYTPEQGAARQALRAAIAKAEGK